MGRAATEAFVYSFIAILFLDFVIGIGWNGVYNALWPSDAGPPMSAATRPAGAAPGDPIIELLDLSMRFRQQSVLRDINLTIRRGETVCIIGESGCGKTVMLKLMIGLLQPTAGHGPVRRPRPRHARRARAEPRPGSGSASCSRWPRCSTA